MRKVPTSYQCGPDSDLGSYALGEPIFNSYFTSARWLWDEACRAELAEVLFVIHLK